MQVVAGKIYLICDECEARFDYDSAMIITGKTVTNELKDLCRNCMESAAVDTCAGCGRWFRSIALNDLCECVHCEAAVYAESYDSIYVTADAVAEILIWTNKDYRRMNELAVEAAAYSIPLAVLVKERLK